jgi:predicted enzyme related to lactoylglutathione lyase
MDMKLEVVPIPVREVDAAKDFYTRQVGFGLDHDGRPCENMRVVLTAAAAVGLVRVLVSCRRRGRRYWCGESGV